MVRILYADEALCVAVKPSGVLSTDEPGGMPELVRAALGGGEARTVHRLDRVVGGLMVLARSADAAANLSAQIRADAFGKDYLAVLHGAPAEAQGVLRDLLLRDKAERKTYVVAHREKGVQEAELAYRLLGRAGALSLVQIVLRTGRTHQIRAQFSARGLPLAGDRKYGFPDGVEPIALWSRGLRFAHPSTGAPMSFSALPPPDEIWAKFPYIPE